MADANGYRMPLAEWLGHMAAARLGAGGRVIAIYAAVFDITGNDELAELTGIKDRSLDKWKKQLVEDGWVVISGRKGGRGHGIEVLPSLRSAPVTLTDVRPKKGGKYYPRNNCETPVEIAGVMGAETPAKNAETPAEKTPVKNTPVISAETPAKITPVSVKTPAKTTGVVTRAEE